MALGPQPEAPGPADLATAIEQRFARPAISHEWLTIPGGSEKVVLAILKLLPSAELFTSVYDPAPWPPAIRERPVHASFLNRVPRARSIYPRLLPLMNAAFRSFDLSGFDLVVSSNHACAKNLRLGPSTAHVCYCHTPMRYAWDPSFFDDESLGPAGRLAARALVGRLRRQDRAAAAGPDVFVANSTFVAGRIAAYYRRDARVIHPPVDVGRLLEAPHEDEGYYLFLGRIVPYKRADHAVAACARLDRPLKVVGDGRALDQARALAGRRTEFLGHVADADLPRLLRGARALLFPGQEDFGIVPVEAQAAGVPVIAYGSGGVRDSVIDGQTGVLYEEQSVAGLCQGIERFEAASFDDRLLRRQAARFSPERFEREFGSLLLELPDVQGRGSRERAA